LASSAMQSRSRKRFKEVRRDTAEIGSVADAIAEPVDHEAVGAKLVMSEMGRVACEAVDRCKGVDIERSNERPEIGRAGGERIGLVGVTEDRNVQAPKGRDPAGRKVVAIEMGEAEGCDFAEPDARSIETFCQYARADAGVDKQDAGRRSEDRCVSGRAAGKDADFEGHWPRA
jgi:hypothetical protein